MKDSERGDILFSLVSSASKYLTYRSLMLTGFALVAGRRADQLRDRRFVVFHRLFATAKRQLLEASRERREQCFNCIVIKNLMGRIIEQRPFSRTASDHRVARVFRYLEDYFFEQVRLLGTKGLSHKSAIRLEFVKISNIFFLIPVL